MRRYYVEINADRSWELYKQTKEIIVVNLMNLENNLKQFCLVRAKQDLRLLSFHIHAVWFNLQVSYVCVILSQAWLQSLLIKASYSTTCNAEFYYLRSFVHKMSAQRHRHCKIAISTAQSSSILNSARILENTPINTAVLSTSASHIISLFSNSNEIQFIIELHRRYDNAQYTEHDENMLSDDEDALRSNEKQWDTMRLSEKERDLEQEVIKLLTRERWFDWFITTERFWIESTTTSSWRWAIESRRRFWDRRLQRQVLSWSTELQSSTVWVWYRAQYERRHCRKHFYDILYNIWVVDEVFIEKFQ